MSQKTETNVIPKWLKSELFEDVIKKTLDNFKCIKKFNAYRALSPGENYATIMMRVEIDVELNDSSLKTISFMMKLPFESDLFDNFMSTYDLFHVENQMYKKIVPELEEILKEAGINERFGAKIYDLKIKHKNVLLEDLRTNGFKNANRLEGLDMKHTKCVLKKLAFWHAASVKRVEKYGAYSKLYSEGFLTPKNLKNATEMNFKNGQQFIDITKNFMGDEKYFDKILKLQDKATDIIYNCQKYNPNNFNVLNHGDCWTNNIMFQYDKDGNITETYLIDYQVPKYGSPAQDLLYFILSSSKLNIKLENFDELIKYYHDQLVDTLNVLKYSGKIPTLSELHIILIENGIWGYFICIGTLATVLCDPHENANFDTFLSDTVEGANFRQIFYSNDRFQEHVKAIFLWLLNRGALDY